VTNADAAAPVSDAEAAALFADLAEASGLILAISGGPDSTALMFLMAHWRERLAAGPKLMAVTVDHGLRPQSRREAAAVKRLAAKLGLPHRTMRWSGEKPRTGVQAAARAARYRLLARAAGDAGVRHIVTAHTLDDQAETVLFRLACGSGIAGLAGMAQLAGLVVVRHRHFADPVRDVVQHVQPGDALRGQQLGRVRFLFLEHGSQHVAGPHLITPGALHVQYGRLQHAAEGERLLRLPVAAAAELLERLRQVRVEVDAELAQIRADGGENLFALGIVRKRVEQVLERQVCMPPRACFPVGNRENDFQSGAEHVGLRYSSSMTAFSG